MSAPYLGDFAEDATVHFMWSTNDGNGASVAPTVAGTVSVYKDNGVSQSTAGVTDARAFDGLVGIHACTIITTDAFYATGSNFSVVLSASTIDGETVNAPLAHFSIQNRFNNAAGVKTAIEAAGSHLALIKAATDNLPDLGALTTIGNELTRALGLVQENQHIDTYTFDSQGRVTGFRLRTYSVAGNVGTGTNVLATYTGTVTYDTSGIASYSMVKA